MPRAEEQLDWSHAAVVGAAQLVWAYSDVVAEDTDPELAGARERSKLPADPAKIEDAILTILALLRDPRPAGGRLILEASGPETALFLKGASIPETEQLLVGILVVLPDFLTAEELQICRKGGAILDKAEAKRARGETDQSPWSTDEEPIVEQHGEILQRRFREANRLRAVAETCRFPGAPRPATGGSGAGCATALLLATVFTMACLLVV